ncbi:MAG TPA: sulfate ABC transporter substrate-binding protein [Tepidisphaeraceae bacterium]|nr:sulfate ABC transporter substrate-binding protein [Tepidisphaeraceae bacterium]
MRTLLIHLSTAALAASLVFTGCKREESQPTAATTQPAGAAASAAPVTLMVASYDPTREMYEKFGPLFATHYKEKAGRDVTVNMSHGPSGKQARDIAAGKEADVAALSVDYDIDVISQAKLIPADWRARLPNDAVPYYSAVVFLVRSGNPKNIKDWADLARPDVTALAPDPKTGGGARWIYLSTWAHALRKAKAEGKTDEQATEAARAYTAKVYDDAITDPAMRGSTTRFIQQQTGDVLFGWENEILQVVNDPAAKGKFEIVVPSDSITIEVPISIVDEVARKRDTTDAANAFVQYLFAEPGQDLVARFYNRPYSTAVAEKYKAQFPPLNLYRFKEHFKDWPTVMKQHFETGGELDRMRGK